MRSKASKKVRFSKRGLFVFWGVGGFLLGALLLGIFRRKDKPQGTSILA